MSASSSPQKGKSAQPRWQRRSGARPEEILNAALEEFTAKGFDAARMEDIAKKAGLSKAGVYLYFESKEALLKALIEAKVSPLAQQVEMIASVGAADPLNALRLITQTAATRFADPSVFAVPRLVIGLSARFPEIAEYYRVHVGEVARAALERMIQAGVDKGLFRDDLDVKVAARGFIGPLLFEAMWMHVLQGKASLDDPAALVNAHLKLLLEGLEKRA
jgi:AcrR family transcriptional regulator